MWTARFVRDDDAWRALVPAEVEDAPAWRARLERAARYYGGSIDFTRVRVIVGLNPGPGSLCLQERVLIGAGILRRSGGVPSARHLVHEFGHVWEFQHGQWQVALGFVEQVRNLVEDVYDYGGAAGVRAAVAEGRALASFNREQQAEIFADDFSAKEAGRADAWSSDLAILTAPALATPPG